MGDIERNLFLINEKIKRACETYGRRVSDVNLVAVSKTVKQEKIIQAINYGCKIFGENYVQEAEEKWPSLKEKFPQINVHLIGHLQSNKVPQALDLFDCIESLDSEKLALVFKKEIAKCKKNPEFFIQVNIGEEEQKSGIMPAQTREFIGFVKNDCQLNLTGLMCIPPEGEAASSYFALLAKIARENGLQKLSMGMSADFEEGIAIGATHIRVGSAVFGARS